MFICCEMIVASVVFPNPLEPENRIWPSGASLSFALSIAVWSTDLIGACQINSAKLWGLWEIFQLVAVSSEIFLISIVFLTNKNIGINMLNLKKKAREKSDFLIWFLEMIEYISQNFFWGRRNNYRIRHDFCKTSQQWILHPALWEKFWHFIRLW